MQNKVVEKNGLRMCCWPCYSVRPQRGHGALWRASYEMRQVRPRLRYEIWLFLCKTHQLRRRLRSQTCTVGSVLAAKNWLCYGTSITKTQKNVDAKKMPKALLCKFPIVTPKTNHVFRTWIGKTCEAKPWYFSIRACSFRRMACRRATLGTSE